jgi:hypothetical protein
MSTEITNQINGILEKQKTVNRHSFFQLKYFLINKEPTHQAKMWRCLRELEVRKESLEAVEMELEECQDNLDLADIEIQKMQIGGGLNASNPQLSELNSKEKQIHIKKANRKKISLQKNLVSLNKRKEELSEEAVFLLKALNKLEEIESIKPYDDLDAQKEYWNEKIKQKIQLRGLLGQPIDLELAEITLALADDMPVKQEMVQGLQERKRIAQQHYLKEENGD